MIGTKSCEDVGREELDDRTWRPQPCNLEN